MLYALTMASVYVTTVAWCLLYVWGYVECWKEYLADKREHDKVRDLYILLPTATTRLTRATYFLKMVHVRLFIGAVAIFMLVNFPPEPDQSPFSILFRLLFILDAWWFVAAKRTDRVSRAESNKNMKRAEEVQRREEAARAGRVVEEDLFEERER